MSTKEDPVSELPLERSDARIRQMMPRLLEERESSGLKGLVGGLEAVIINTEPAYQKAAVEELLRYTGLELEGAYDTGGHSTFVLKTGNSAAFLISSRQKDNPFWGANLFPRTGHLPNTRLETLVFEIRDIDRYVSIQRSLGTPFMTDRVLEAPGYRFIQTAPSPYTGNSLGFVQWRRRGDFLSAGPEAATAGLEKPDRDHLRNIRHLDHAATRVRAEERDAAILEFMRLTNYEFDFAIYVQSLNSITSVARLKGERYAMVFTSGISSFVDLSTSGPTEKFIHNYGTRVHHMAFHTEKIEETFQAIKDDGMEFLIELVGSPEEGLKQTFTVPSPSTMLVNEYIHRYGDFDGFFTRSNVTRLTKATDRQ
ncbi:MAG: hypothetical protein GKC10_08960 [Methanosarcinales archaeon]|nr:hypothetical protein [Methanosarcinales archaeon]